MWAAWMSWFDGLGGGVSLVRLLTREIVLYDVTWICILWEFVGIWLIPLCIENIEHLQLQHGTCILLQRDSHSRRINL